MFTVTNVIRGSPDIATYTFQCSADGTNYAVIGNYSTVTTNIDFISTAQPVAHLKATFTNISGGSTPTLTLKAIGINY